MAGIARPKPTGAALLVPVGSVAPLVDPTTGRKAPTDWANPTLWTPGNLACVCIATVTFDDPDRGRVTLDVSLWRDPLEKDGPYSAMVETW